MRIENLRTEFGTDKAKVIATVIWEDYDQPVTDVYFETDAAFADSLTCNPHAFLVASLIPAFHFGERRILIKEEICPELREGLLAVMTLMRHWYYKPDKQLVQIETKTRAKVLTPNKPPRTGVFVSGGLDSFAALRSNRLNFSPEHPGSFKDGLIVFGFHGEEPDHFKQVLASLSEVAEEVGITPIQIRTNLVALGPGWAFWADELFGAAFAAVAHAFTNRLTTVALASAGFCFPRKFDPHGSHPLIDPNYSSSDLRIHHDGIALSRLEKARLISDWDFALKHLRVCNRTGSVRSETLNCGKCEKCIRTMLSFSALGILHKVPVFPAQDISADLVRSVRLSSVSVRCYHELLAPLAERGRKDLVSAIEDKIKQCERSEKLNRWKTKLKQFDRKYLNSSLVHLNQTLLQKKEMARKL
ncbi:hypothetical protein [Candidatus Manganitrophus noduliformans]|uniref:Uncharacterized protein n=1 Tax=Candidatus Manganitrophus noduliformans TaxID=2606439 RepID=A0A7X6IC49_9BACT|nr:hypothetical protein [Candidatus Manganitrophus noduliformans]NKE72115.1 hypothetical protein [Candidatus Manganitrophus noduliformans]